MATKLTGKRSFYWDNIKGILIVLVVFAHILYQLQHISNTVNYLVDSIYLFHMPAFIFVSGYFGKSKNSRSFASVMKWVFLYFIFNSIMGFIYGFSSLLQPLYSCWYLLSLIVWRISAPYLAKFRFIVPIAFVSALLVGFFPTIDNTLALSRTIAFYPFYLLGYLCQEKQIDRLLQISNFRRIFIGIYTFIILSVISAVCCQYFGYTDSALTMGAYSSGIKSLLGRAVMFLIATLSITALCFLSPNRKIPLLSTFGKNSLWIFLLHRPITLIVSRFLNRLKDYSWAVILISAIVTVLIGLLFGNDVVSRYLNSFAQSGTEIFLRKNPKKFTPAKAISLLIILCFLILPFTDTSTSLYYHAREYIADKVQPDTDTNKKTAEVSAVETGSNEEDDAIFRIMDSKQREKFDNAFRITFAGDLILLEDQVKRGYIGNNSYDYSEVFAYAQKYIWSADLAIGVFEGPMAGAKAGYSVSNFDDGKKLFLNFPDEFATAVKEAGFDLVTTANNHLLDKGVSGAKRTLDILDKAELPHIGSYRSAKEKAKEHIKLLQYDGLKIAVLSYTYGSNYYDTAELTDGELSYLTSVADGVSGKSFEVMKENVKKDFSEAKKMKPDLILVLPHMGTQFSNEPDETQKVWFSYFKELGADIILGDHAHAVQPIEIETKGEKNIFTAYCPGNFANIYREHQGDSSMLIDVYISRTGKKIVGGSIVPLYTQSPINGNYRALPIYDILTDSRLKKQLSTDDLARVEEAHHLITETVFGHSIDMYSIAERYYFDAKGFLRQKVTGLEMTDEMRNSTLAKAIANASSVCFLGDSLTEGTKNGGVAWYEPLEEHFSDTEFQNFSKGGCTVSYLRQNIEKIPHADLYVVAVGTNDVRYRDEKYCAMSAKDFAEEIDKLRIGLVQKNPDAKFVFIAPWYSTDGDKVSKLSYEEKYKLNNEYAEVLRDYCEENFVGYIDANKYLRTILTRYPQKNYLTDYIHPNGKEGVILYSRAVLKAGI